MRIAPYSMPTPAEARRRAVIAFSLVEVLVSVAVITILFVSLYSGISSGFGFVQLARENLRATQILQERMETIRLYNWDQINTANFIPASFTEAFYSTNANNAANAGDFVYTGTVAVASTSLTENYSTNMRMVTVTLNWTSGRVPRTRQAVTFVARNGLQNYIY